MEFLLQYLDKVIDVNIWIVFAGLAVLPACFVTPINSRIRSRRFNKSRHCGGQCLVMVYLVSVGSSGRHAEQLPA